VISALARMTPPYEIARSEERGRHLLAARAIAAGEVAVRQEAYACVLYDDQVAHRCDYCLMPCESPLRCSRSKFARCDGRGRGCVGSV
jgi:hypothetical protein